MKVLKNVSPWFLLSQSAPSKKLVYSGGKPLRHSGLFQFWIWGPYIPNHSITWCHFILRCNTQLHIRHLTSHPSSSSLFSNLQIECYCVCCQLYSSPNKSFCSCFFLIVHIIFLGTRDLHILFRVYIQLRFHKFTQLHCEEKGNGRNCLNSLFYYHLGCIFLFPFYRDIKINSPKFNNFLLLNHPRVLIIGYNYPGDIMFINKKEKWDIKWLPIFFTVVIKSIKSRHKKYSLFLIQASLFCHLRKFCHLHQAFLHSKYFRIFPSLCIILLQLPCIRTIFHSFFLVLISVGY